jgi:hypothetical protein
MDHFSLALLAVLSGLSLCVQFTIESSTWYFRSLPAGSRGLGGLLSIANQVLYSSRIFAFVFQLCIALLVDYGAPKQFLLGGFVVAIIGSTLVHALLFFGPGQVVLHKLAGRLVDGDPRILSTRFTGGATPYVLKAAASTILICAAAVVPYGLALTFPTIRLTMGSLSQVLNSLGAIMLISVVEPTLYRSLDRDSLPQQLGEYFVGRIYGFCASLLVLIPFF